MGQLEIYLVTLMGFVRNALRDFKGEEGFVVEKVILVAIFAILAIAVGAIITSKVLAKANSVDLNGGAQ